MLEGCPVQTPKLLKAKSTVVTCASCGAWSYRIPTFMGTEDMWDCDKCGNTSCYERQGRSYSSKSRRWDDIVKSFNDVWTDIPHWDWDTVETEPPLKDIDWAAIEAWYRSMNIYRTFIELPQIEVVETAPNHFQVTVLESETQ